MSTAFAISVYVMWTLLLVLAFAVFALYRHFGQMYVNTGDGRTQQGPAIGQALLSLARHDVDGQELQLPTSQPTLLLFADTACDICAVIRDQLDVLDVYADNLKVVVFCAGRAADVRAWSSRVPRYAHVVADRKASAANHYGVNGTPFIVAVGLDGTVHAKSVINGDDGLLWAADQALSLPRSDIDVTGRVEQETRS